MNTFWRVWFAALGELVVVDLAGSLLGPLLRTEWSYEWGYLSGMFGPIALVVLALSLPLWLRERGTL